MDPNVTLGLIFMIMRSFVMTLVWGILLTLIFSSCNTFRPSSLDNSVMSTPSGIGFNTATTFIPPKLDANPNNAALLLRSSIVLSPTRVISLTKKLPIEYSRYSFLVHLNYQQHHLTVSQTITYVNRSSETLTELLFVVEANRRPGVFRLNSLRWVDGHSIKEYKLNRANLQIPLQGPLLPGEVITLSLAFELSLPARSSYLGYTSRQTNLGDWYPYIPPHRPGYSWLVHEPATTGEHLVYDVANYQVDINVVDAPSHLIVAASTPMTATEKGYHYHLNAVRSFAWSVSPDYQVITQSTGAVTLASYVFPEHLTAGKAALVASANALSIYSGLFGAYPHTYLSIVEADFFDGMEYDGLYYLGQEYYADYAGNPRSYLIALAAHETAHQWWYGLVGNDQATEPWLDESLATYSELLFYEKMYPDLTDWWWNFRVIRFNPTGWVNSTIYGYKSFRPYVNAVYLRGVLFLQALRELIGDEAFFAFLQDYTKHNAHQQATVKDFFEILADHNSSDLSRLKKIYFR